MIAMEALEAIIRRVVREELDKADEPKTVDSLENADITKGYRDSVGDLWRHSHGNRWQWQDADGDWSSPLVSWTIDNCGPFTEVR